TEGLEVVGAERAARHGQTRQLPARGCDQSGMAVTEVQRRVRREEIEVPATAVVLDPRAASASERHRQRDARRPTASDDRRLRTSARVGQQFRGHRSSSVQHFTAPPALTNSDTSTGTGSNPWARTTFDIPVATLGSTTWHPSLTALRPSAYASGARTRIAS